MSDFLTRMAKLSCGEAKVVEPCIPSLYAPVEERGLTGQTELTESSDTLVSNAPTVDDALPSRSKTESHRDAGLTTAVGNEQPKQINAETPATKNTIRDRPSGRETDTHRHTPTLLIKPAAERLDDTNITATVTTDREHHNRQETILPTAAQTTPDRDPAINVMPSAVPVAHTTQADVALPRQPLPLVTNYQSQQPTPQQVMAERPPATEQTNQAQPTVHINIGRVDVRAHTASASPAPRPARSKADNGLSLNDYLNRGSLNRGRGRS